MEVGVHTVVFGGRPESEDMQLVGGIKGSQVLKFDQIAGLANYLLGSKLKDVLAPPVLLVPPLAAN